MAGDAAVSHVGTRSSTLSSITVRSGLTTCRFGRVHGKVEVAVASRQAGVEGDPQAAVGAGPDEREPVVADDGDRAQVPLVGQRQDLVDDRAVARLVVDFGRACRRVGGHRA